MQLYRGTVPWYFFVPVPSLFFKICSVVPVTWYFSSKVLDVFEAFYSVAPKLFTPSYGIDCRKSCRQPATQNVLLRKSLYARNRRGFVRLKAMRIKKRMLTLAHILGQNATKIVEHFMDTVPQRHVTCFSFPQKILKELFIKTSTLSTALPSSASVKVSFLSEKTYLNPKNQG